MTSWRRAIGLGLLVWLVPFMVAFAVFPLKESWRSLFESIMPVTLAVVVVLSTLLYRRKSPTWSVCEARRLGIVWLVISAAIDLPLMLSPPISYTLTEYLADVGLTYLMIPIITTGMGWASRTATSEPRAGQDI